MDERSFRTRNIWAWIRGPHSPKLFLAGAAFFIVGGTWLFFGILEDVVNNDPLVKLDLRVYHFLQERRTPNLDQFMVGVTELGDVHVIVPVIVAALGWFVWRRQWQTALYWILAVGFAQILVKVLKFALQRPRPGIFYAGVEQFSFPSSHALMSTVVYGFLAFLLCHHQSGVRCKVIAFVAASLIALILFSRLYLGAHWMSDVVAGLSFAVAWVAALATVYVYRSSEKISARGLTLLLTVTLVVAGGVHIAKQHAADLVRYAPPLRSE